MSEEGRMQEMYTLKTIAETLNTSNDLSMMLDTVIGKLLGLTGLTTGWLFLIGERGEYSFIADYDLPPALQRHEKQPMRCGTCWCLNRFWDGRLDNAVNVLNCKRLEDAREYQWGDTYDITHHATVPLRSGEKMLGLLNVAAPNKEHFSESELALLQAVAYQIGSAIERMRLYRAEQRRADLFAKLGGFSSALGLAVNECKHLDSLAETTVSLLGQHYDWPFAALLKLREDRLVVQAAHVVGALQRRSLYEDFPSDGLNVVQRAIELYRVTKLSASEVQEIATSSARSLPVPVLSSGLAVPILSIIPGEAGVLVVGYAQSSVLPQADHEVLEAIAEHITASWESLKLAEQRRELARLEERNRLARDLHDSVNQILFSLSLTAKGAESMMLGSAELEPIREAMKDVRSLSQEALKEMRALIMQLRPAGLEKGLMSALQEYGAGQGLQVVVHRSGMGSLPRSVEDGLWRIGQEALNNIRKHAGVNAAEIILHLSDREVTLSVSDRGKGGAKRRGALPNSSLGLSIMKERAQALGGRLEIVSSARKGTTVTVIVPLTSETVEN
ncbi:GAF domain-containing protein [Bacillales bacterium AN1005]